MEPTPPRWNHDTVEETLPAGTRPLTVSVADAVLRGWWEAMSGVAGIPPRRWRRHHPAPRERPIVALVDGAAAFDVTAWWRFASLVPGARAMPTRTARWLGVPPQALRPPRPRSPFVVDLARARRARGRMRRRERRLDAELARFEAWLAGSVVAPALAPADDDTPFDRLPAYALAARIEETLHSARQWHAPALVDLAGGHAMAEVVRLLRAQGCDEAAASVRAAQLASGGGVAVPAFLDELPSIGAHGDGIERWMSRHGWHAMSDLALEAVPFRYQREAVLELAQRPPADETVHAAPAGPPPDDDHDPQLREAAARLRLLTARRERIARSRADLHAALRGLTWTLGERLVESEQLRAREEVFDVDVGTLLRLARGVSVELATAPRRAAVIAPAVGPGDSVATAPDLLRGTAASPGTATAPAAVIAEPKLDTPVDGAVLVCRMTDPGWMPLLMRCAALVTERGGPLSHAAIVARELGLPAVVGVPDATRSLPHGALVRVDGSTGIVQRADR